MHPLPAQPDDGSVPPEQRGMHIARGSIIAHTARPVGALDASLLEKFKELGGKVLNADS